MTTSGHRGMYEPQEYGVPLYDSEGTMIRNLSSHIPITTPTEAITVVVIDRSFRIVRSGKGRTKLQTTMVQNNGEYLPICVDQSAAISCGVFPYQVTRRSLKTK